MALSTLRVAIVVRHACRSPASQHLEVKPQSADIRSGQIAGPVRSCRQRGDPHRHGQRASSLRGPDAGQGMRQVRHRPGQPLTLFLKLFEFLQLVGSHAAILLAPAVERLLRNLNLPDGVNPRHALAAKPLNLPQLRDNRFRPVSFDSHL